MGLGRLYLGALVLALGFAASETRAQSRVPPYDVWDEATLVKIRDGSTLDIRLSTHLGYWDVFFNSNTSADWFDAASPYAEHHNETIRIHAFLASPLIGGPYPALVLGHGHHGHADRDLALAVAALGYVALSIDGPNAGQSTGGPEDENQAWISVDKGAQYGYLYHYAYAGMRALTLLEALAKFPANLFRIDPSRLGVLGASMGGIFATYMNGIDDRVKAAVVIASAGNWQHSLRYPNSWLYNGIYSGTRDLPYNGSDPLNSIEDVDNDATTINFLNYFDPIRYAPRQRAPILTVIGTHDQYFPLPNANLMELAITSAGTQQNFEKRLWLLPNEPHRFDTSVTNLVQLVVGVRQWLDYAFGKRDKPLATPEVSLDASGGDLVFDITAQDTDERLSRAEAKLYAATRVDSTPSQIDDFKAYSASRTGSRFRARIAATERSSSGELLRADNVIYFATLTDPQGLPVSSLVYKGGRPIDLSTDFQPTIGPFPGSTVSAPVPPPRVDAASSLVSVAPVRGATFEGLAVSNPGADPITVRVEASTTAGRVAAAEGLVNPVFIPLPSRSQRAFVLEEWLGPGARDLGGGLKLGWSSTQGSTLAFRGALAPSDLEEIGTPAPRVSRIWVPLAPEHDPAAPRTLKVFCGSGSGAADVDLTFRDRTGAVVESRTLRVGENGVGETTPPAAAASADVRSTLAIAARLEVRGTRDGWSIDGDAPQGGTLVQPHVEWNGVFTTRIVVLNTAASAGSVRFRLRNPSGAPAASETTLTVAANGSASTTVESLFAIAPGAPAGAGWLEAEPTGGIIVEALASDPARGAVAATPLHPADSVSWSLPFFVEDSNYYTGLALANPNDSDATVEITAYDRSGGVLGRTTSTLGARQRQTRLVSQWIAGLAAAATGHLVLTASSPVSILAYFGTDDGAALAAIPPTRVDTLK